MPSKIFISKAGLVTGIMLFAACTKATTTSGPPTKASQMSAPAQSVDNIAGHVKRGKERQQNQNDLKQLALMYSTYITEMGRPPAQWKDFQTYIRRDVSAALIKSIEDGELIITWNARPASNVVVIYEKNVDLNGNQLVAMGDGSVTLMTPQELQASLKNR